uniref:1-deoxy-D-xylulose-5-phosphate synthase n=1 Tax=Marinobacterium profundum TaxID=1714300 RepID=UPI00082D80A2|nr:1-deoxy-D-xylulose-5-phosphate synthase [Marinobacterium profundum]
MFEQIPLQRPATALLNSIDCPAQLRELSPAQLPELAEQLRAFLLYSVGQTGGHFGAGLGVIELTVALHYCLNTPEDHLIWDVGHQSYPHKILTGRREQMFSMRQQDGLAPFPKRAESACDAFGTGHSSTSISAALGMALADRLQGRSRRSVAVIGDGAMTAGMAFEALNHAGHTGANLLVILNDNDMSISHNEGGLATYLAKNLKHRTDSNVAAPLFEALEFAYTGPLDGHDLDTLLPALRKVLNAQGPQFLHIVTRKGKGFAPAEADPVGYHAITKIEPVVKPRAPAKPKFANIFGRWICDQAEGDAKLVAITPAMCEGSDLIEFSQRFPERYFDVAIAEQHALTLAAGLACGGMKPVVAIYSTFLQRAYDQLVHDIAIQQLDVLLTLDRAGLVGEDGATHAGLFDIACLRTLPNMLIMTPSDEQELRDLLYTGYMHPGPAAVRYPRGGGQGLVPGDCMVQIPLGQSRTLRQGKGAALLNFGPLLPQAEAAAQALDLTLVDMRFVKPLDESRISALVASHSLLVTLEDHAVQGGAGSAVAEYLQARGLGGDLLCLGVPDRWIEHASRAEQLVDCGLSADQIITRIKARLKA